MSVQNLLNAELDNQNAQQSTVKTVKKFLCLACKKTVLYHRRADHFTTIAHQTAVGITDPVLTRMCEVCNVTVVAKHFERHTNSVEHQQRIGAVDPRSKLSHCEYCDSYVHPGGWARHLKTAKHLKAMEDASSAVEEDVEPLTPLPEQ